MSNDKPTKIEYFIDTDIVSYREWRVNDKLHRTNGPAFIRYHRNGKVSEEHWFEDGNPHYLKYPAEVWYFDDGIIRYQRYWFYGMRLSERGKLREWLDENGISEPFSDEDFMAMRLYFG